MSISKKTKMILLAAIAGVLLGLASTLTRRRKLWFVFALIYAMVAVVAIMTVINLYSPSAVQLFASFAFFLGITALASERLLSSRDLRVGRSPAVPVMPGGSSGGPAAQ